jgi:hypothetical protein
VVEVTGTVVVEESVVVGRAVVLGARVVLGCTVVLVGAVVLGPSVVADGIVVALSVVSVVLEPPVSRRAQPAGDSPARRPMKVTPRTISVRLMLSYPSVAGLPHVD